MISEPFSACMKYKNIYAYEDLELCVYIETSGPLKCVTMHNFTYMFDKPMHFRFKPGVLNFNLHDQELSYNPPSFQI